MTRARVMGSLDELGDVSAPGGPVADAERNQAADAVTAAVAALPAAQGVVIVLHHFGGLLSGEVAQITSSTVPAVRSHLFRGRRTLARTLTGGERGMADSGQDVAWLLHPDRTATSPQRCASPAQV